MTQAIVFSTPLLLVGLAAAGIPPLLHMLSKVRAKELAFPTLRFLRMSVERTARRRKIQNLLLMMTRSLLLAVLAIAVAEPITRGSESWLGGEQHAAVIVLDNSMSMSARSGEATRLALAKTEATELLGGDDKPKLAGVIITNSPDSSLEMTAGFEDLRRKILQAPPTGGQASLDAAAAQAMNMLRGEHVGKKSIYIFSDMQRSSFQRLVESGDLAEDKDVYVFIIDTSARDTRDVGIRSLKIGGQPIADSLLTFEAELVNSSPTDQTVDVLLRADGGDGGGEKIIRRAKKTLSAAGGKGSRATVSFRHRFSESGTATGAVLLENSDALADDNVRRFCLNIGGRAEAIIVHGDSDYAATRPLRIGLEPFTDPQTPWPINMRTAAIGELDAARLAGADIVFLYDVPAFTAEQAKDITDFASGGGTVVFFLGPAVDKENYNQRFMQETTEGGGLLPGRLVGAVGEIGPTAPAASLQWVDMEHPYLAGLFEDMNKYLLVLTQRYFRLEPSPVEPHVLMRLANGDPLLLVKDFGRGRVVLCTTAISQNWANLSAEGAVVMMPAMQRAAIMSAGRNEGAKQLSYQAGAQVTLAMKTGLPDGAVLTVTLPENSPGDKRVLPVAIKQTAPKGPAAVFTDTQTPGEYRWRVVSPSQPDKILDEGAFVVNPSGEEADLAQMTPSELLTALHRAGVEHVYIAASCADAHAAAAETARGRNWWDMLLVAAFLVLVAESVIANRRQAS